jgi:leucyl-tRNA synthetase
MGGCFRFLQRVWTITQEFLEDKTTDSAKYNQTILRATHKTTKKVTEDVRGMGFNTAISALMELTNDLYKIKATDGFADRASWQYALTNITQLLAPFAPHIAEELWEQLGGQESVHLTSWPTWDDALLLSDTMSIVVQVNGKLRANIELPVDATRENILAAAKSDAKVTSFIEGQTIRKEIYVPGKLVNLVV